MKSLLMKSEMILAYQRGKTETRRIIWPQPILNYRPELYRVEFDKFGCARWRYDDPTQSNAVAAVRGPDEPAYIKPKLTPGERFYLRETWGDLDADHPSVKGGRKPQQGDRLVYRADPSSDYQWGAGKPSQGNFVWRPSLLMPEWAARYFPTCTGVDAQLLQSITPADAIVEGVKSVQEYRALWNDINLEPKPVYWKTCCTKRKIIVGYRSFPWNMEDFLTTYPLWSSEEWKGKLLTVIPNPWVWRIQFTDKAK